MMFTPAGERHLGRATAKKRQQERGSGRLPMESRGDEIMKARAGM